MPIDYDDMMQSGATGLTAAYDEKDVMLYALGIGMGRDPLDEKELAFVYENNGLKVVPTFASVINRGEAPPERQRMPQKSAVNFALVVDGERRITIHKPLPPKCEVISDERMLAILDKGTTVAGVFTRSKCPSAPVEWCRAKLAQGAGAGSARVLVVNSGNANAFTGKTGRQATALTAAIAAKAVGCQAGEVFLASTGVIGEPLDAAKFDGVLSDLAAQAVPGDWMSAARAIMTTDTFPKVATATVTLGKAKVTINGMAKGAGMIAPDMATMLSFVFTDAPISAAA